MKDLELSPFDIEVNTYYIRLSHVINKFTLLYKPIGKILLSKHKKLSGIQNLLNAYRVLPLYLRSH